MNTGQAIDFAGPCSWFPGSPAEPAPRNDDVPAFFRTLLASLTESQTPNIEYLCIHQHQGVVFNDIFIRIGGPEWTGVRARKVKRALPAMSRRSVRCWAMPIGSSRCMITAWGC